MATRLPLRAGSVRWRALGALLLLIAALSGYILYREVHRGPWHQPRAAELLLGLMTFLPASLGSDMLWLGDRLSR